MEFRADVAWRIGFFRSKKMTLCSQSTVALYTFPGQFITDDWLLPRGCFQGVG
jgi:hypothetical protein